LWKNVWNQRIKKEEKRDAVSSSSRWHLFKPTMKNFIAITVAILVGVSLPVAPSAKDNTVVLSSRLWSRPSEQEFMINEIFKPFEQEHNCLVVFHIFEDEERLLQQAEVQVNTNHVSTDIFVVYCARMQDWVERGYVMALTEYVNSWTSRRTFPEGLSKMTTFNGNQYFLPIGADAYLLIANKKALKYLPEGVDVQDISWEQVVDWSLAMAQGEGEGKFAVTGAPQKMLIYQYGGVILSYGDGFPTINSSGALQAWELLVTMKDAYTANVLAYESVIEPMKYEEAWLAVAHCARVGDIYRSNPSQFVVAPAPKGPAGIGSVAGTRGLAIMKDAPHKALAIKLLEYITRPEIQLKIAKGAGGFIPPVKEAVDLLGENLEDEIIHKTLLVMDKGNLAFIPPTFGDKWRFVKVIYDNAFRNLVLKEGAVNKVFLDNAQEEIDALEVEGLLLKSPATIRGK
jgi:multiple sugar transport system substrate-binding protein